MESETCNADSRLKLGLVRGSTLFWKFSLQWFGNDEQIPGRLVIKSLEFDGEEEEQEK